MELVETVTRQGILWLKLVVELVGALVIGVGCARTAWSLLRTGSERRTTFNAARLSLAGYLALGLEFQLAADILITAVDPSWEELGKLGSIAAIRTLLNFFLAREMKEERVEVQEERAERADEARAAREGTGQTTVLTTTP